MIVDELWARLRDQVAREAVEAFRLAFSKQVLVGPFDDAGLVPKGEEHGSGFAIFIGEWRIGWWKSRAEAAETADRLSAAIEQHECHHRNGAEQC